MGAYGCHSRRETKHAKEEKKENELYNDHQAPENVDLGVIIDKQ